MHGSGQCFHGNHGGGGGPIGVSMVLTRCMILGGTYWDGSGQCLHCTNHIRN